MPEAPGIGLGKSSKIKQKDQHVENEKNDGIRDEDKMFTLSVFLESRMEGKFIQRCDRRDIS